MDGLDSEKYLTPDVLRIIIWHYMCVEDLQDLLKRSEKIKATLISSMCVACFSNIQLVHSHMISINVSDGEILLPMIKVDSYGPPSTSRGPSQLFAVT